MKKMLTSRKAILSLTALSLLCSLFVSCKLMQVREDVKTLQESVVLVGVVSSTVSYEDMPVVVAAYASQDRKRAIVHYTTLHELGPYELMVPQGTHNIVAFGDKNMNLTYDAGEPAGQILSAEQIVVPAGGVHGNLDIVITEARGRHIDLPIGSTMPPKTHKKFHSTCPGAIADINDTVFSDEYGKKGFWAGLEFYREIGGNVYFLEAYDPNKTPILFVHGAAGSPQNWRTFFNSIDRRKYQPWFYYYPSGSSIDSMSYLLFWKMQRLQTKYKFKELYITAHSMGGLVVRSFLVNYGQYFPSIASFISISTPWGGEELAEMGVKYSPAVIPSWVDMQPESDCIQSLFSRRMPSTVEYYLFFGHRGNRNLLRPNNDKVVTLESQLDQRSQRDAKMIYGFNEDHISILSSQQVLSQYNAILADREQKSKALSTLAGNRLIVDFSFDLSEERPRPNPGIYLRPVDEEGTETFFYLGPEDTGREHGPFPSGQYDVSVIAPAFVPEPNRIRLTIEDGTVPRARFALKPTGYLRGYVANQEQAYMQAGKERQLDTEVAIQTITLKGDGIHRTLIPHQAEELGYTELFPEHYLSGTDFSVQGTFFFFELPAGEYELTVHAEGYKPCSQSCQVQIGQYHNTLVLELEENLTRP